MRVICILLSYIEKNLIVLFIQSFMPPVKRAHPNDLTITNLVFLIDLRPTNESRSSKKGLWDVERLMFDDNRSKGSLFSFFLCTNDQNWCWTSRSGAETVCVFYDGIFGLFMLFGVVNLILFHYFSKFFLIPFLFDLLMEWIRRFGAC